MPASRNGVTIGYHARRRLKGTVAVLSTTNFSELASLRDGRRRRILTAAA
jgi:hypothetical protein